MRKAEGQKLDFCTECGEKLAAGESGALYLCLKCAENHKAEKEKRW